MTTPRHRRRMAVSVLGSKCPAFWSREGNGGYQGGQGGRCVRKGFVSSKGLTLSGDVRVGEIFFGKESSQMNYQYVTLHTYNK
jgi:hypothetical protein